MAIKFPSSGTSSYISCGNISIPAGDWAIFFGLNVGALTGSQTRQAYVSIGDASDTILGDANHIVIGTSNPSGASAYQLRQLMATGRDSNSLSFGTRPIADYMDLTTSRNVLSGPGVLSSGNIFVCLQKSGTEIQLWHADSGRTAVCYHKAIGMDAWAGISAKPLLLGALNRASITAGVTVSSAMQRFGRVAKALTQAQMERLFNGADPVTLLSMNSGDGDLYWAFDNTAALNASETYNDSIQGQTATVNGGSWQTPTQIIPLTEGTSDVRAILRPVYLLMESPGEIKLDGTYRATGTTITVQARVLNSGTQAVITDWTTMQTVASGSGEWTGLMPGMTRQVLDLELQLRLVIDGVNQTAVTGIVFQCGVVLNLLGQSLMEYIRTASAFQTTVPSNIYSFSGSTAVPAGSNYLTSAQKDFRHHTAGMSQFLAGYGEVRLGQLISEGASCRVVVICDAQAGSTIDQWNNDSNLLKSRAIENIRRFGRAIVLWEQGQSNSSTSDYVDRLETLYQSFVTAIGVDNFEFGVSPLALTLDDSNTSSGIGARRREQADWANTKGSNVFLADNNTNDIKLSDNVHEAGDIDGAGRMVERWAQTILQRLGVSTYTGEGPELTGISWDGATTITVNVSQNGGSGLQTPNVAAITGFEVSGDGGSTYAITVSDAQITAADEITLTLGSTPGQSPLVRYQWGGPGPTPTAGQSTATRRTNAGIDNPVYDDREPGLNTALGFPVGFTVSPLEVSAESNDTTLQSLLDPTGTGSGINIIRRIDAGSKSNYYCSSNISLPGHARWVEVATSDSDEVKSAAIVAAMTP